MKQFDWEYFRKIIKEAFGPSLATVLILAIVQPFGLDTMEKGRIPYILLMGLITFLTALLSSIIVRRHFGGLGKYLQTFLIFLINLPILSFCFGLMTSLLYSSQLSFSLVFPFFKYVGALSIFLFLWECLLIKKNSLEKELGDVKALNALLEKRQEEYSASENRCKCVLKGQTNSPALELDVDSIIYIESIANYADICYADGDDIVHKTLRITLKTVRESIGEDNSLVQCHRAFIVNLNFVVAIEKDDNNYQLQLFGMDKRIPVSRSNAPAIKQKLS